VTAVAIGAVAALIPVGMLVASGRQAWVAGGGGDAIAVVSAVAAAAVILTAAVPRRRMAADMTSHG
jgi:hypothetical protein